MAVAESSQEKRDAVRVRRLTPNNMWGTPVDGLPGREAENLFGTDQGRAPTETLSSCHVLSGLPITRSLTVQSPAAHVKDAVCWLWGRQHSAASRASHCCRSQPKPASLGPAATSAPWLMLLLGDAGASCRAAQATRPDDYRYMAGEGKDEFGIRVSGVTTRMNNIE